MCPMLGMSRYTISDHALYNVSSQMEVGRQLMGIGAEASSSSRRLRAKNCTTEGEKAGVSLRRSQSRSVSAGAHVCVHYLVAFLLGNKIHLVNKAEDHRVRGGLLQRLHTLLVPLEVALLETM